jgi:hypothetical protein
MALSLTYGPVRGLAQCMDITTQFHNNLSRLAAKGTIALRDLKLALPTPFSTGEGIEIDLNGADVVYIYGVGDGESYRQLKGWLHDDSRRFIAYFEHDLGALRSAMEGDRLDLLLQDPQVKLFLLQKGQKNEMLLNWCYTYFSGLRTSFTALPSYLTQYPEAVAELKRSVGCHGYDATVILQELFTNCAGFFANFYPNVMRLPDHYHGNRLFGRFRGIPAIICGAGPSLEKNVDLLRGLRDRALIFAPGSAMNALGSFGVMPHLGCASDPNVDQIDRFERNSLFEVPLFYANRWHRSILPFWHSPPLFLHGLGMHQIEHWIEEGLGLTGGETVEPCHSATHLCLNIARLLGCGPIILVGQDLAYSGGKFYSEQVGASSSARPSHLGASDHFYERPIAMRSVWGDEIETAWKWIVEARWISQWAARHPEVALVNATEGGLGIEGIPNLTLKEVAKGLKNSFPLDERLFAEIAEAKIRNIQPSDIETLLRSFQESLERSLPIVGQLVDELERMEQKGGQTLRTGRAALLESDFNDELAYRLVFDGILTLCSATLCRQFEQWRRLSPREAQLAKIRLDRDKYGFVREGIEVHLQLLKGVLGC